MKPELLLYSRKHCCLCDEMKRVISAVAKRIPLNVSEVDVDSSPDLIQAYGNDVPVLFINRRKAFKHRASEKELERKLKRA
ncbi:MAG TPA: glutaredoxin family protein [Candidatus Binatia bacterium]|jgi:thiol-disulfide isomerase/thioredoxin